MNSWFSLMKSSVNPLSLRSCPKCSRQRGSKASNRANSDICEPLRLIEEREGLWAAGGRFDRGDSGGVGAEECLCPKRLPSRLDF